VKTRFDQFTLDSETRQLLRDGEEIHLSPKAFDLLCTLMAQRPNVVTKDDLFRRIWPKTFVVEANLNVLVGELRRAMGDSAQTPRFIRTAHGVGYAFCGEAADLDKAASSERASQTRFWLEGRDRTYALAAGDNIVGRDPRSSIWLNDSSVSRRHARIRIADAEGTALLDDLDSTNGTFIGRARVKTQAALADGDTVKIGSVELKFREGPEKLPATKPVRRSPRAALRKGS
jgi:DNA-binding winged helix-turn-helix (wHTH) protein